MLPGVERAAAQLFPAGRIADPDVTHTEAEYRAWIASRVAWVAEEAEQVVGYVVGRELEGGLHVDELAVDPGFGRRGIGTALMRRIIEEASRRGLHRLTLTTFEDLPWNAPFYRSLGFIVLHGAAVTAPLQRLLDAERQAGMTRRVAMAFNRQDAA